MAYCGDSSCLRALRIQIWHGRQWACFSSDTLCASVILGVHPGIGPPSTGSGATVFVEQRPCYERFFLQKLHIILAGTYVVRSHEALSRCYVKWTPQPWEGIGPFSSLRELPLYMAEIPSARPGIEAFRTHHQSIARMQPSTRVLGA